MAKYIVTISPPTPNGNLHLGHIAGPFLTADIFARIRKQMNDEVVFVSYSDDYQDYVERKAMQIGQDKFELAKHFSKEISSTLKSIEIELDCFMAAYENKHYKDAVSMFYNAAKKTVAIKEKTCQVPFSEKENIYGYEAFGRGTCNFCGEESDPSQCENCANSPILDKMGAIKSIFTNEILDYKSINREYLSLSKYKDVLIEYYSNASIRKYLHTFILDVFENGDLDWYVDRPFSNGIDIEYEGSEKIIHTWFSGIAGYYAATKEYAESINKKGLFENYWEDKNTQIVSFIGFDCSFSHAIVYPSLLLNIPQLTANITPIPNRFLKLEGGDFSTSRGHAIWVDDILKDYTSDAVRFYLALNSPETEVKNFEMTAFTEWSNSFYEPAKSKLYNLHFSNDMVVTMDFDNHVLKLINEWKKYGTKEDFSITKLAEIGKELLKRIVDLEDNKFSSIIALYLVLNSAVHPNLSNELIDKYNIDKTLIMDCIMNIEPVLI
jgi:methionyl-tRNA synthetase